MGRRVSSGVSGGSGIGAINIIGNRITSVKTDADIELSPNGSGDVVISSDIDLLTQNDLKFFDTDSSNYVAFQAPISVSSDITWTLPDADGSANQVLTTNGIGTLTWSTIALPINNDTSTNSNHYPLLTTSTSGTSSTFKVSSTKFSFNPNTGNLSVAGSITANGATVPSGFTSAYSSSGLTLDANGFISGFTANGITYSTITYTVLSGLGTDFNGTYRVPTSWSETDNITNVTKTIAVTYNANGLVSTITVT